MAYQVGPRAAPHSTPPTTEPFLPTRHRHALQLPRVSNAALRLPMPPRTPTLRPTRPSDKKRLRCARRVVLTSRS